MCKFASFVLTKNNEYYSTISDSHEDIIDTFKLKDDEVNIVRVELLLPENFSDIKDASKWKFEVDQDKYPDWTYKGDPILEEKARKALQKRIEEQHIGYTIEKGNWRVVKVEDYQIAITGDKGKSIAGRYGRAISGKKGKSITEDYGISISGDYGISFSDHYGTAISGYKGESTVISGKAITGDYGKAKTDFRGNATAGNYGEACAGTGGTAIVGDFGVATVGCEGKAKAGKGGQLRIYCKYSSYTCDFVTGKIGEDGLEPNIFYRIEKFNFVKA